MTLYVLFMLFTVCMSVCNLFHIIILLRNDFFVCLFLYSFFLYKYYVTCMQIADDERWFWQLYLNSKVTIISLLYQ